MIVIPELVKCRQEDPWGPQLSLARLSEEPCLKEREKRGGGGKDIVQGAYSKTGGAVDNRAGYISHRKGFQTGSSQVCTVTLLAACTDEIGRNTTGYLMSLTGQFFG